MAERNIPDPGGQEGGGYWSSAAGTVPGQTGNPGGYPLSTSAYMVPNSASFVPSSQGLRPMSSTEMYMLQQQSMAMASQNYSGVGMSSGGMNSTAAPFVPSSSSLGNSGGGNPYRQGRPQQNNWNRSSGSHTKNSHGGSRGGGSMYGHDDGGEQDSMGMGVGAGEHEADQHTPQRMVQVTRGGCTFFVPESQALVEEGGIATQIPMGNGCNFEPSVAFTPRKRTLRDLSVMQELRDIYERQNMLMLRQLDVADERYKEIPSRFHCIYPLDSDGKRRTAAGSFGYPSVVYKVVSKVDGHVYTLRRFDNVKTTPEIVQSAVDLWSNVRHPNIVPLFRGFIANRALFFVREYFPGAESFQSRYLVNPGQLLPESLLWSYTTQLLSALRAIHSADRACRVVTAPHVLVTTMNRVRINDVGVLDVIEYESKKNIQQLQQEDIVQLGLLICSLACRMPVTTASVEKSLEFVGHSYSAKLASFIALLVSKAPSVFELCVSPLLGSYFMDELDRMYNVCDGLEDGVIKEAENGRLLRLLMKLGMIVERPQLNMDSSWAETGDRYLLKLFRDYLFHQVGEERKPVIDPGHVVESLNKLDVGDQEELLLTSRDEKSILVVSFKDLRRCLEKSFEELCGNAVSTEYDGSPARSGHPSHPPGGRNTSNTTPSRGQGPSQAPRSYGSAGNASRRPRRRGVGNSVILYS